MNQLHLYAGPEWDDKTYMVSYADTRAGRENARISADACVTRNPDYFVWSVPNAATYEDDAGVCCWSAPFGREWAD